MFDWDDADTCRPDPEALTCFLLSPSRSTVVPTYTTSSMATMSSAATGCGTSTPRARWPNRTWWPVRTARRSSSTPSGPWSPSRSCWCGTVRSFPRDSAASRSNPTAWSQVSHGLRDYPTLFGIGEGKTAWSVGFYRYFGFFFFLLYLCCVLFCFLEDC